MRCLHCGKELALLKRLTGGAEFCSDAHRKQYQKEYNDLALGRLLQSHPTPLPAKPTLAEPLPPDPPPAPIPPVSESPEMAGFLLEPPSAGEPEALPFAGECEPPIAAPLPPALPAWVYHPEAIARAIPWAEEVAWNIAVDSAGSVVKLREFSPEFRESARPGSAAIAAFPAMALVLDRPAIRVSREDPLEIAYAFRPPQNAPELWLAPLGECPQPAPMLGQLTEPDIDIVKNSEDKTIRDPEPVESSASASPREAFTEPLPVTIQGVSAPPAKAESIDSSGTKQLTALLPALPDMPLRPTMVLKALAQSARVAASASPTAVIPPSPPPPQKIEEPAPVAPPVEQSLPKLHIVEDKGLWARMPFAVKIGLAACLAIALATFAYTALQSGNATAKSLPAQAPWVTGNPLNTKGWIDDWAPADPLRRITMLRDTERYSNYRLQFTARIQTKAIGWMFRGLNPKNFYVAKLDKITPGLDPVVAFVRYAVIDGKNEGRVEKVLPMKVRSDTAYKIRFDATGSRFSVWVQGKKIDEWEDARLGSGGLGLYSEGDEAPAIQGSVEAFELVSEGR